MTIEEAGNIISISLDKACKSGVFGTLEVVEYHSALITMRNFIQESKIKTSEAEAQKNNTKLTIKNK